MNFNFHITGMDDTRKLLNSLLTQGEMIMATMQDLQTAITQVTTDAAIAKAAVVTTMTGLATQVATLQAQVAAGSGVTPADLDTLLATINNADVQVKDIIPSPVA